MTNTKDRHREVLVAVQQALLGEVTPNMRAVGLSYGDQSIKVRIYLDGETTEGDEESASLVETELMAAFPEEHQVRVDLVHLAAPAPIPKTEVWAYHRKEPLR